MAPERPSARAPIIPIMKPKRVNLLALACMMLGLAAMQAFSHHYGTACFGVGVTIFLVIVHLIRQRRFKRYDQMQAFD